MKKWEVQISNILSIRAKFGPALPPSEMVSFTLLFQTAVSEVTHPLALAVFRVCSHPPVLINAGLMYYSRNNLWKATILKTALPQLQSMLSHAMQWFSL